MTTSARPSSSPLPPDTGEVYGIVAMGGADVAIPLSVTREVIARPAEFSRLPVATSGLLGAVELRGMVVPVFDLRERLGLDEGPGEHDAIVIVSETSRVLGILANELRGVRMVLAHELMPLRIADADLLLSHTFKHPETGAVTSVLDLAQVLKLPGVFSTTGNASLTGGAAGAAGTADHYLEQRATLTLLQCGEHTIALDIVDIHTTLPAAQARPSILTNSVCQGVMRFREYDVAVLDPLMLLGLGQLSSEQCGPGVVLEINGQFVVLAVTRLISLEKMSQSGIRPIPTLALNRPDLISGLAQTELVGDAIVLDGAAIRRDRDVLAWASVNVLSEAGDSQTVGALESRGPAQLTYSIGVPVATALQQVSEILPYPSTLVGTSGPHYLRGILSHRDITVSIVCLATLLGREPGPLTTASCVLLIASARGQIGYVVDGLTGIDPLTWHDERAAGQASSGVDPARALSSSPLIRVGDADKLIPNLDLQALTAALVGEVEDLSGPELAPSYAA